MRVTAASCAFFFALQLTADSGPFDGKNFKGRIAWSADGNFNDEDDWAASPVALAIFAEFGVKDKLVHFDYNSILNGNKPEWAKIHETSVLGAVERYAFPRARFYDDLTDLDAAIASIARAIDASSAQDPLYFVVAGPMEVAYKGIQRSRPEKRKFVYVISHSRWNDGFSDDEYNHNKRDVIPQGINWVQIADQNRWLSTSPFGKPATDEQWKPWDWMRDSDDPNVRWLHERLRVTTRADCSDAGMAYFLMTGDQEPEIAKLRTLLDDNRPPASTDPRPMMRLEAENFRELDHFEIDYQNDRKASHRISLKLLGDAGVIRTPLGEPYSSLRARYDVEVRFSGAGQLSLWVGGKQRGEAWTASAEKWTSHTIADVEIQTGDEIRIDASGESTMLDYVQLNRK